MPANSSSYTVLNDSGGAPILLEKDVWGSVYKAFHGALHCHVALRVIPHSAFLSDDVRDKFVREVEMASHLRQSNLAAVLPLKDAGTSFLYARELVGGESLQTFLHLNAPITQTRALAALSQITRLIEIAFTKGLIHHNICGETVRLSLDDEILMVKVVDMGLPARCYSTCFLDSNTKSEIEIPEEAVGDGSDIIATIYSLGLLLGYMMLGSEHCTSVLAKARRCRIALHPGNGPDLSAEMITVLNGALRTGSENRFESLADFRAGLDKAISAETERVIRRNRKFRGIRKDVTLLSSPPLVSLPSEVEREMNRPGSPAARKLPAIPEEFLNVSQTGAVLTLRPNDNDSLPAFVVSTRDCVKMGRAHSRAGDLITRFLPRSHANDHRTRRLSKVQVTAKLECDKVLLLDGDGCSASANGSKFAEAVLSPNTPLVLDRPGELLLANDYSIEVIPSISTDKNEFLICNIDQWNGPKTPNQCMANGCVLFTPDHIGQSRLIWLFSAAHFGSGDSGAINFDQQPGKATLGTIHHYCNSFWLESRSNDEILLNGHALEVGTVVPLISKQILRIKNSIYHVEVEM